MKFLLLGCAAVLALVVADPIPPYSAFDYHEQVGIKEATRVKAAEEAVDFDGSRIVGGSLATLGQYPFMVRFAAHCWWDGRNRAQQFVVVLGSLTIYTGGTRITTTNVQMHEDWDLTSSAQYDVAIITFNWINYSNNIRNIQLPTGPLISENFVGSTVFTMGWGKTTDAAVIPNSQQLRHVTLNVVENAVCRSLYGPVIVNSIICARGETTESTCNGDSGGPLAFLEGSQPVLIGIGAFNHRDSCQRRFPVAFTRVTSHLNWINRQIMW